MNLTTTMRQNWYRSIFAVALFALLVEVSSAQEVGPPRMKMTTEIPKGVTTPDNIQTRVGQLNFFDGVPDIESAQKVYNLLDFTHAYQAFLDGKKLPPWMAFAKGSSNSVHRTRPRFCSKN